MKDMRMGKRLNNKGFTLVELLAVVVILALVMGIAATSMLNTMNSSRKNTLHSAAQTAASNLNNWVADDMLVTDSTKLKLGTIWITYTQSTKKDTWICLSDTNLKLNNGKDFLQALSLSSEDLIITGTAPVANTYKAVAKNATTGYYPLAAYCSAVRFNSNTGGYEFFLRASTTGKYYVAADGTQYNYAFSRATGPNLKIND